MNDEIVGKAKGGMARAEALTPEQRSEIARKAASARWDPATPKAEFGSPDRPLMLGDAEIPCYVLEDGTRVIARYGVLKAIGRKGKAKGGRQYDDEFQTPVFLTADNLKPFISKELIENSKPIIFRVNNSQVIGYRAEFLPQICEVFLDAKEAGALRSNQRHIAVACKILHRGFARIGIIGLIDEATGYQEARNRLALQTILDRYLRKELAAWAKRFPDEFYQQIFRLRGWDWKGMKVNRPQVVANYTKDFVYERLAPGILRGLEETNPIDEKGQRKAKHHQWLTEDVGHPALAQHIYAVMSLMRVSTSWDQFKNMLDRAFPKKGNTIPLNLDS